MNIAICSLVRNAESYWNTFLKNIECISSLANQTDLIIVENDSIDKTKELLYNTKAHVISEDLGLPLLGGGTDDFRLNTMAMLRNKYLDKLYELNKTRCFDYVFILDSDIHEIDLDGLKHSFSVAHRWDVCTSNGIGIHQNNVDLIYYDILALVIQGRVQNTIALKALNKYRDLIYVDSAFGGLAIYKMETFKDSRYKLVQLPGDHCSWHPDIRNTCEHVGLHLNMIKNGYRIVINPRQVVYR